MKFKRSSGILLHPTSLPGSYGIGDIGPEAHRWIQFLAEAGIGLWQILPLGPTGYGDSPYQCFSAFAGNPYLISPDALHADRLLTKDDLDNHPPFPTEHTDYGAIIPWKLELLNKAYRSFQARAEPALRTAYQDFRALQAEWLDDFAMFMALKSEHGGAPWPTWEPTLRDREPDALATFRSQQAETIERQAFWQFLFFRQWGDVRREANRLGIKIIGDIPIFVAHDSADVWTHRSLFYLDDAGNPLVVAGVPPDYFSITGQRWGNPLYDWDKHAADDFTWWLARIKAVLQLVDIVRLDHFRGFAGYWEIPADEVTAVNGRWVKGPGEKLFDTIQRSLGDLPIIAEDLGVITPDVVALRERFQLPGMRILQFAFAGGPGDPFLPHHYPENCAVYTGTHDNDTARGWYERVPENERHFYRQYFNRSGEDISWDLIRACWASVAVFAIAPMQDFLNLDNSARMNYPSNPSGNWTWRMPIEACNEFLQTRIKGINYLYSRGISESPFADPEKDQARIFSE